MSQKIATKEYVDTQVKGIRAGVDSMGAFETIIHNNPYKQIYVITDAPIDFNGCTLPKYTMIFIPCALEGTDMLGFACNSTASHFWAIGHTWTSGGAWSARQIF